MRAALLLLAPAATACHGGEATAPADAGPACDALGEPWLEIGGGSWDEGWETLETGDTIELLPGRIGKRPYELALRVAGVDTSEAGLEEVEVLAWADDFQVGGYFGRPPFVPVAGGPAETYGVEVVADVDDAVVQRRAIDFVATAADRCGRRAEGHLVLTSILRKPST